MNLRNTLITSFVIIAALEGNSQTTYADKIADWKKQFKKEDVIAVSHKEIVNFSLNPDAKPGESKVKATVLNEITIVPVKDFMKYEDGVFYYDEVAIENLKALNAENKEVKIEK